MTVWRDNPEARIEQAPNGRWWHEDPGDPDWLMLGFAPMPRTTWQGFWYHVHHGCLMRYSPWSVLWFAWRFRRSFREAE